MLQREEVKGSIMMGMAKPVVVKIRTQNALILEGKEKSRIGHIPGNQLLRRREGFPDNRRSTSWILKKTGKNAEIMVEVISEKAGTDHKKVLLK